VKAGGIIVRQLGTKVKKGEGSRWKNVFGRRRNWKNRTFLDTHLSPSRLDSAFCPRRRLRSSSFDVDQGGKRVESASEAYRESAFHLLFCDARRRSFFSFFLSTSTSPPSSSSLFPPPPTNPHPPTQPATQFHPGTDVGRGTDDTLFALTEGIVVYKVTKHERSVSVVPVDKFEVPEGQRRAEVSRRTKRLAQFTPRAAQREALVAAAAAAVAVPAAP